VRKAARGVTTVRRPGGSSPKEQTFLLNPAPRLPAISDADGAEQQKMAMDVGNQIKTLYDTLGKLRDAKKQAGDIAAKAGASSPVSAAAKSFTDKGAAVGGGLTQLQGEANQDALNFPGRLDNQWVSLYGDLTQLERKVNKSIRERLTDLRAPTDDLMRRAQTVLTTDVAAFNDVSSKAGAGTIAI